MRIDLKPTKLDFFFMKCIVCVDEYVVRRPVADIIAHVSTYNSVSRPLAARMSILSFAALFDDFGCNFSFVNPNEMLFEALKH